MKIAVAGTGYVGLSMAVLLAQNNEVTAVDIIPEIVPDSDNIITNAMSRYMTKLKGFIELNFKKSLP